MSKRTARHVRWAVLLVLWVFLATFCAQAPELPDPLLQQPDGTIPVTVHHVVDGDTVDIVDADGIAHRVRLLNIDTPELQDGDCYAEQASDLLDGLIGQRNTPVHLLFERQQHDRYGRLLAQVWTNDGIWVNGWLLERGAGKALAVAPNTAHFSHAVQWEQRAKANNRGLWGAC